MKKIISLLLVLVMLLSLAACTSDSKDRDRDDDDDDDGVTVMSHKKYMAADLDTEVTIETYVQGHQSWWDNKVTVYCQSPDGAYFLYELACSEADAANLLPGTKIRVTGYKSEWAGEIEIVDGTFEFVDEDDTYIAKATDVTDLLGTDELIDHQNEFVSFTDMTVEAVEYKNGEPGDDIYLTLGYDGSSYNFCVEVYLTGPDSDVYTTVGTLNVGDVVDVEGYLYWYEDMNPHVTSITVVSSTPVATEATPEATEAPAAASDFTSSSAYTTICSVIDESMGDMSPEYEFDAENNILYISLTAPEGTAAALLTDPDAMAESWENLKTSFGELSTSVENLLDTSGYPEIVCCIMLLNDANTDNVLLGIVSGEVAYDSMAE